MKMIEPKQKQLIHIAKTQCGLSDVEYRDLLAGQTKDKKTSSSDLTYFEADAVINYFVKTLGFNVKSNYIRTSGAARRQRWAYAHTRRSGNKPLPGNVVAMPSPVQMQLIDDLAGQVTWKFEDGFTRWLGKYIKTDKIRTSAQAQRAIEGLKGLLTNQNKKGHCEPSLDRRGNLNGDIRD